MAFKPASDLIFKSRNDLEDIRIGDIVRSLPDESLTTSKKNPLFFLLQGYPDDEGIQLNGGRLGAGLAPDKIREFLFKMTPPHSEFDLFDNGNFAMKASLREKQLAAQQINLKNFDKFKIISLGGGHDWAYADGSAFLKFILKNKKQSKNKPIILNFDAHLDLRPTTKGPHSGNPFRYLKEEFKDYFDLIEIGLQPQCNSPRHLHWAQDNNVQLYFLNQVKKMGLLNILKKLKLFDRPIWLSLDIDVFSSVEAPGCSQSWGTGLTIEEFLPALNYLCELDNIYGLGVYEVSPPLDFDNRTSKLAALIIYHYLFSTQLDSKIKRNNSKKKKKK